MPSPSSLQWLSLVAVIWLQSINGPNADFPIYSSQLKNLLSITQVQLNNLAFASDAGKLFGWLSGIAAVYLPLWLVLLIGATLGFIGYGVQYLFLINKVTSLTYVQVFALSVLGGNAICWINTVCYMVSIVNFPSNSRVAVGLSTSYVGLSAKVYTVLADAIFHPQSESKARAYLLLNSLAPMLVAFVTAPLARDATKGRRGCLQQHGEGGFMVLFLAALATGVCAMVSSVGSVTDGLSSIPHAVSLASLLAAPLVVPLVTKCREVSERRRCGKKERRVHGLTVDDEVVVVVSVEGEGKATDGCEAKEEEGRGDGATVEKEEGVGDLGVSEMVRRVEFWLYFLGYFFGPSIGLVFLNNLGQIVESRGLAKDKTSHLVALASSAGFFGRFVPPLLDYMLPQCMASSPAFITALMGPMAAAFFLLLNPSNLYLYTATAVIGACTGAITSVAISTTTELFGRKHFGVNHNVVVINIPLGSFTFGYMAASMYQREDREGNGKCMGVRCYSGTFVIWGAFCSLGTLLFLVLYLRTRRHLSEKTSSGSTRRIDAENRLPTV